MDSLKPLVAKWREGRVGEHAPHSSRALMAMCLCADELEAALERIAPMPTREQVAMACCKAWENCSCTAPCGQITGVNDVMDFRKMADAVLALFGKSEVNGK